MSEDRCIICGEIIPEGMHVCPNCEKGEKPMKCNHFKEYPDCSFFYNGLCLREHIYECPPLMNMKNLSHGEMVQIAEGKKNKPPRYIDANKLIDMAMHEGAYGYVDVHDIYNAPTADVVERKKGEWTTHEVACLLAEVTGDDCACNVNGNDEWLPFVCEFAETTCPDVVGVACWEQWLVHRKGKTDG